MAPTPRRSRHIWFSVMMKLDDGGEEPRCQGEGVKVFSDLCHMKENMHHWLDGGCDFFIVSPCDAHIWSANSFFSEYCSKLCFSQYMVTFTYTGQLQPRKRIFTATPETRGGLRVTVTTVTTLTAVPTVATVTTVLRPNQSAWSSAVCLLKRNLV